MFRPPSSDMSRKKSTNDISTRSRVRGCPPYLGSAKGEIAKRIPVDEDIISVFLPTTPNPTSGFLLFLPRHSVMELDMSVEDAAKLVISIVAGLTTAVMQNNLASDTRIIRTVPNTPVFVGEGMVAIAADGPARPEDYTIAKALFSPVARTALIPEKLMDAALGVSGSGPAYVFLMVEALADGGVKMGLPREVALTLAAQTLLGCQVPISKLRGHFHDYGGIRLLPTYHPAYLLRNPSAKRDVWQDMQMLMKVYDYDQ